MAAALTRWVREWTRRWGPHGEVWRARDTLADTLSDVPEHRRAAFSDVLPTLDALLTAELPQLQAEALFIQRYLARVDVGDLRAQSRELERSLYAASDQELREVRQRNLDLVRSQLQRIELLQATVARYEDQVRGLCLAVGELAGRIAAANLEGGGAEVEPELERLRLDVECLAHELAALGADLSA